MSGNHFEAKNYALRKSKDGVIVSFVVHPNDLDDALLSLPIGAHVMIAWKEYSEEQEPVAQRIEHRNSTPSVEGSNPSGLAKPRRAFKDLSLPEQAGIRCEDARFQEFIKARHGVASAVYVPGFVRMHCDVKSRAEFSTNRDAANRWRELEADYQRWLTDNQYKDSVR